MDPGTRVAGGLARLQSASSHPSWTPAWCQDSGTRTGSRGARLPGTAPAWRMSRSPMFAVANVLPDPAAIWISALGWLSRRDRSRFVMASNWARRRRPWSSAGEGCWAVEPEHAQRRRLGIEAARESGFSSGGLAPIGQATFDRAGGQLVGDAALVLHRLTLHPRQGRPLLLCLAHADRLAVHEQHVVRGPGGREHRVDLPTRLPFGRDVRVVRTGHDHPRLRNAAGGIVQPCSASACEPGRGVGPSERCGTLACAKHVNMRS